MLPRHNKNKLKIFFRECHQWSQILRTTKSLLIIWRIITIPFGFRPTCHTDVRLRKIFTKVQCSGAQKGISIRGRDKILSLSMCSGPCARRAGDCMARLQRSSAGRIPSKTNKLSIARRHLVTMR